MKIDSSNDKFNGTETHTKNHFSKKKKNMKFS